MGFKSFFGKKVPTLNCSCERINVFTVISHISILLLYQVTYRPVQAALQTAGHLASPGLAVIAIILLHRGREQTRYVRERERERIHTKGRVGGEGSGANCAHDSIRAAGREREPASKQGFLFPCSACAPFRKRERAATRVVRPFSWNSLTKRSAWYLRTGRKSASVKTKKVEWAEESDRGKHPRNSAVYMLQEVEFIHLYYCSEIKLNPALSWSRAAASAAASPAIMCFYLWDAWSDLAGDRQSWTLNTVSMCCVCSVCIFVSGC